jgi:capsular polysaccharide biosynthesis protein
MTLRSIGTSLLRYWYVVVGGAILFAAIAGAIAASESTVYSAQTYVYAPSAAAPLNTSPAVLDRQMVNTFEFLRDEEIPSRVLSEADVDMEPGEAAARVNVSQFPGADIIVVSATASTSEMAISLAGAAAEHYADVINDQSAERLARLARVLSAEETSVTLSGLDALALSLLQEEARVLGAATVSSSATSVTQSAVFGGMVGILFGALVAVALGYVKVPTGSEGEIEELTGLAVLGRVDDSATVPREAGTPDARIELIATTMAERVVGAGSSTVVLVPAQVGTGVQQIAQDVARGLAAQGKDVAVVDATDTPDRDGLAQLADPGQSVSSLAEQVSVGTGRVSLLPPGRTPVPFASWIGTTEAEGALTRLAESCSFAIVVGPPLPKDASGLLLASQIGSAVLVVPETMSRSGAAAAASDLHRSDLKYAEVLVVS